MRQTELQLEEQVKEAKKKIKPVNNELREIVSFLLDGQRTRAGTLLSKYTDKPKVKELMGFFIKQPPPVQYELGQVYRKALGVDENLALAYTYKNITTILRYEFHFVSFAIQTNYVLY